jgi:hypothetical protein
MLKVVHDGAGRDAASGSAVSSSLLDAIVRDGARQMLAAALAAEVAAYIEAHSGEVDVNGHRLVVRNGYHAEREVTTAAGAVTVRAPRVNDKRIDEATGQRCRFLRRSCPPGHGSRRRRRRCCRCCICTACPPATSPGVGAVPGHQPRVVGGHDHPVDQAVEGRRPSVRRPGRWPRSTACMCRSTGSTSRSASSRTKCACW